MVAFACIKIGPPSNRTSANPSPAPNTNYDRMEGQFSANGASSNLVLNYFFFLQYFYFD